jgi:uncharacterized membrane protein
MNRYLLILFLLVFISACTVQKRLHRPGWNVSWNKKYKHNKGSDKLAEIESKEAIEGNHDEVELALSENAPKEKEEIESPNSTIQVYVAEDEVENKPIYTSIENNTSTHQTKPTNSEKQEDSKKTKWHDNYGFGIFFTIIFILCGVVCYRIITGTAETQNQQFSKYIMSGLLGILGLISFIIANILFFSPEKDKKIKKVEEVKDKKELEKISKRTTFTFIVVLILSVLFAVLIARH